MHELSIAGRVLDVALTNASGRRVRAVRLRVGHLRQVVPSALSFAWELSARGTAAEGAELALETVPAAGACTECGEESPLSAFPLLCRACGSDRVKVIRGEELIVDWIELEEPEREDRHDRRHEGPGARKPA